VNLPQCADEVRPEERRLVLARIERYPTGRVLPAGRVSEPFGKQRRLAETGGRDDDREPVRGSASERLDQSRTQNEARLRPRDVELGLEQRARGARVVIFPRLV
jgi:hypothetical protein